jgi:phosphate transport system substrate-binding protein
MKRIVILLLCLTLSICSGCKYIENARSGQTGQSEISDQQNTASIPAEPPDQQDTTPTQPATAPEIPAPKFSVDEYPRVDGSTANIPLMIKILCETTGISESEAEAIITVSKTDLAYSELISSRADLLLVYEPSADTIRRLDLDQLEFYPIGMDALVFIANEKNPVDNLTTVQLRDIYSGKITNWESLGGHNEIIEAYQRAENSGSQALFVKLLMQGVKPMQAHADYYSDSMFDLVDVLSAYDAGNANAIGFSVYYYIRNMYMLPGIKLLSVDGVMPSNGTIADGSYPFTNNFYAVIRKSSPADSPERKLVEWLFSRGGKQCITDAGYVAAS